MKNLGIKAVIFVLFFVLIDLCIGLAFKQIDNKVAKMPIDQGSTYLQAVYHTNDDVVIFGESMARGAYISPMMADSLNMSVSNFAYHGSSMVHQATVIRLMLKRFTPKVIIWEVDGEMLMHKLDEEEKDRMWLIKPFYTTDSLSRQQVWRCGKYEKIKMLSAAYRNNNHLQNMLRIMAHGNHADSLKGWVGLEVNGYKYPSKRKRMHQNDLSEEKLALFKSTVEVIKKAGSQLVIVNSPQYEESNLENTIQGIAFEKVLTEYGIPHLNHHYDDLLLCDSTLFKDCDHLNYNGAVIYMNEFIPELKALLSK